MIFRWAVVAPTVRWAAIADHIAIAIAGQIAIAVTDGIDAVVGHTDALLAQVPASAVLVAVA